MKLGSLIRTACFVTLVSSVSLYVYFSFAVTKSSDTGIMRETALLIPVVAALALLLALNLRYFSSRLKPKSPGLAQTVPWFFFLASFGVLLLNLSKIWFITPMRVISYFLVALILSLLLNAGTYLRFYKRLER